mgnify:CR=1 FL=1
MLIEQLTHTINLPEGVSVDSSSSNIKVTGPRGELSRNFSHESINFEQADNQLKINGTKLRKKEK